MGGLLEIDPNDDLREELEDWIENERQEQFPRAGSTINFIPGEPDGCHDLLVTICPAENDFWINIDKTTALCIDCQPKLRAVIIWSAYWNEKEFDKWRRLSFEALIHKFGIAVFIVTPLGGRWVQFPIERSLRRGKKKK